ncbi:hypothetical protein [Pseudanabaena yagii]|uniref:PEP-CTERM sorting domain-containing protein n=1 Tax=Pseudanabaena yagii GIHE-NHR1 TaxID=2722753 RepID=A0ABX1LLP8_9CYAN|nr:hypothetical protein [Pseudanabaena yagii]NMF56455.1 hypothetical protein [Pseudanabaena yagii GIHE-NHR1]
MKKLIAMSALLSAATATLLSALPSPSFGQTVTLPIIASGTIAVQGSYDGFSYFDYSSFANTTVLTSIGAVNISAFNGQAEFSRPPSSPTSVNVTSSNITFSSGHSAHFHTNTVYSMVFTGTTDGSSPNGAFTNALTTLNATLPSTSSFASLTSVNLNITGGSITLPVVSSSDYLPVSDKLHIAYSSLPSSDQNEPEYQQEYRNDFHSSSFEGGRILGLEDK